MNSQLLTQTRERHVGEKRSSETLSPPAKKPRLSEKDVSLKPEGLLYPNNSTLNPYVGVESVFGEKKMENKGENLVDGAIDHAQMV